MVKNMPESSYELSLKDLVEHHSVDQAHQALEKEALRSVNNNQSLHRRGVVKEKRSKKYERNAMSFEKKGLFLNVVFPVSLESRKKKRFGSNSSGKVSPKPDGLKGGGERDWWKKRFTGSSDSDSGRTSNNSGSAGSSGDGSGYAGGRYVGG